MELQEDFTQKKFQGRLFFLEKIQDKVNSIVRFVLYAHKRHDRVKKKKQKKKKKEKKDTGSKTSSPSAVKVKCLLPIQTSYVTIISDDFRRDRQGVTIMISVTTIFLSIVKILTA